MCSADPRILARTAHTCEHSHTATRPKRPPNVASCGLSAYLAVSIDGKAADLSAAVKSLVRVRLPAMSTNIPQSNVRLTFVLTPSEVRGISADTHP